MIIAIVVGFVVGYFGSRTLFDEHEPPTKIIYVTVSRKKIYGGLFANADDEAAQWQEPSVGIIVLVALVLVACYAAVCYGTVKLNQKKPMWWNQLV